MPHQATILIVEDDRRAAAALARLLEAEQYRVISADSVSAAAKYVDDGIDLVLSDLRLGTEDGIDLLNLWRTKRPLTPFVIMTAYGEVASAVSAMKLGARDYLTKPIHPDHLLALLRKCYEAGAMLAQEDADGNGVSISRLVGQSAAMRSVFVQIRRAASSESTVLILGESGTGKELVANALHEHSARKDRAFVAVNMAAVPDTLAESELFGHVKGSFTGATGSRVGRFQSAEGGTIFIDEIGDFALASQAKLLRVLEARTITPVGSNTEQPVNVRVVAATSRNLDQMVAGGQFREDLYYRLGVITLTIPPLRDRTEDIPLLVRHFLDQLALANKRPRVELEPELMDLLTSSEWPGNVRQLRNCLESMLVMTDKAVLGMGDLPPGFTRGSQRTGDNGLRMPADATMESLERSAMLQALERFQGNRTMAAESLGISVRTLQRRLRDWGILKIPLRP